MSRERPDATMTASASELSPASTEPRLVVNGANGRSVHALPRSGEVILGRGSEADLHVDDPSLSRRHARLKLGPMVVIEDLGSRNGTEVAGRALAKGQSAEIVPGDHFRLGKAVCVVELPTPRQPARAPSRSNAQKLETLIRLVAGSDISAVIHGETGVGKEVTARAIHEASARKAAPFMGINCAALPENLLESELFGYERGAFSGAVQAKPGMFEAAQGGTVFLDEIADMSAVVQAKLLRVLEERQVTRLGSVKPKSIDVRFLAASHRSLEGEVDAGRFRQDLFFRLNGITLEIPPLRERLDELEPLARRFLNDASARMKRPPPALTAGAMAALRAHPWPGNVRELKNVLDRALLLSEGAAIIDVEHVALAAPPGAARKEAAAAPAGPAGGGDDERSRILQALQDAAGNQTRAAELLGISRRTLVNKIIALGIPRPRKGA